MGRGQSAKSVTGRGPTGRFGMGRGTLGLGQGRVGGPSGTFVTGCGTLPEVWDSSVDPPSGPGRVGGLSERPGWVREHP